MSAVPGGSTVEMQEPRMSDVDPTTRASAEAIEGQGFSRMLVCLDGSTTAESVIPLASHMALIDHARMTLLYVLDNPRSDTRGTGALDALEWDIARHEALSYLERLVEEAVELGIETDSHVAEGSVTRRVTDLAAEFEADLIVLATHGENEGGGRPLGGTATKILESSRCPVLVVPSTMPDPAQWAPPRRVLVPLDGSVRSESVLPTALRIARSNEAEVLLAHIVPDPVRTEVLSIEEDLALARQLSDRLVSRAHMYLERIRSQLTAGGVRVRTCVQRSVDHREGLVALAASEQADLIIPSAHGSCCNPRGRFGSVTSYVLAHSPVPVLVIQDLPDHGRSVPIERVSLRPPRSFGASK